MVDLASTNRFLLFYAIAPLFHKIILVFIKTGGTTMVRTFTKTLTVFLFSLASITMAEEALLGVCEEPINVWFKISNDVGNSNYRQVVALDMSQGYAYTDGVAIYLMLSDVGTREQVMLTFPIGYWEVEGKDEIQKEFDNLEEYLRNTESKSDEIKKDND